MRGRDNDHQDWRPRLIAGRFSRAERVRQRACIQLEDAALTEKTLTRYYSALRKLLPYVEQCPGEEFLDSYVCRWIRKMWRTGEPLLTIGDGLSALHFYQPWTRKRLPHSWKLFSVWRKIEVPSRAPPLTLTLVKAMSAYEWSENNFEMAVLLLLSFHCLLRTGEMLSVTANDFQLGKTAGVCSLKHTKSGIRHNADEAISITDMLVLETLRILVQCRLKQNLGSLPLWSGTPAQFRTRFNSLCSLMDLNKYQFRPYSLRRGGATHLFQCTNSMETALLRGRWESTRVARLYISDALSFIPSIKCSQHTLDFVTTFSW